METKGILKSCDRRIFLKKSFQGLSALGILGVGDNLLQARGKNIGKDNKKSLLKEKIIYRTLGKTGIKIPIVNMGVMNSDNPGLLKHSFEKGVRHFDTAAWYQRGKNEELVGKVIKELNVRDQVIIGTKIYLPGNQRGISAEDKTAYFRRVMNESLQRLQTTYVDILYVHSVSDPNYLKEQCIIKVMEEFKKQKKARFIGFTTHANMTEVISEGVKLDMYDVIEVAFNYSMHQKYDYMKTLADVANKGIGLVAMKTQCQQPWYKQNYEPQDSQAYYEKKLIHTALLKWVLNHPFITTAIPGYTNFQEFEEDFSVAYDLTYTQSEKKFLTDKNIKLALSSVCQQCSDCIDTCLNKVDIPALIRTHMYATCYSNFDQARITLKEIPKKIGLNACLQCNKCLAKCTQNVNIDMRIKELKQIYA